MGRGAMGWVRIFLDNWQNAGGRGVLYGDECEPVDVADRGTMVRPGLRYYVGGDPGQKQDHTAIAVVEREETVGTQRDPVTWELDKRVVYAVRCLQRLPLDMWLRGGGGEADAAGEEHPADD